METQVYLYIAIGVIVLLVIAILVLVKGMYGMLEDLENTREREDRLDELFAKLIIKVFPPKKEIIHTNYSYQDAVDTVDKIVKNNEELVSFSKDLESKIAEYENSAKRNAELYENMERREHNNYEKFRKLRLKVRKIPIAEAKRYGLHYVFEKKPRQKCKKK